MVVFLSAFRFVSSLPTWSPCLEGGTTNSLITAYFNAGHKYKTILFSLYGPWRCIVNEPAEAKAEEAGLRRCAERKISIVFAI